MPTPAQIYLRNLNPVTFPPGPSPYEAAKVSLYASLDRLSRALFVTSTKQEARARTYINAMQKAARGNG